MSIPVRAADLTVEDLLEEVLIYQQAAAQAHCLNGFAASVWRACDGERSIDEIVTRVRSAHPAITESEAYAALAELERQQLINIPDAAARSMSRYDFLKRTTAVVGLTALITTVSLARPAPASATP